MAETIEEHTITTTMDERVADEDGDGIVLMMPTDDTHMPDRGDDERETTVLAAYGDHDAALLASNELTDQREAEGVTAHGTGECHTRTVALQDDVAVADTDTLVAEQAMDVLEAEANAEAALPTIDRVRPAEDATQTQPASGSEAGVAAMNEAAVSDGDVVSSEQPLVDGASQAKAVVGATIVPQRERPSNRKQNNAAVREVVPSHHDDEVRSGEAFAAPTMSVLAADQQAAEMDDPMWRQQWPDNEIHIVGRLMPRISDAPPLDGVPRARLELLLVEEHDGAFGTLGTLPLFVMPSAPGFASIRREIERGRLQQRHFKPITVELRGVLRQMPDRDMRYASGRYSMRMGVEVHQLERVAPDAAQFAYWRGRVTVLRFQPYMSKDMAYRRVTAVVLRKHRKLHLRGLGITETRVDFLVLPSHEHIDRFRHIGQRLLVEATISGDVSHLNATHTDLEGVEDPRRRAHLQVLRDTLVTASLGEFPDDEAARAYRAWAKSARPHELPERRPAYRVADVPRDVTAQKQADGDTHEVDRTVPKQKNRKAQQKQSQAATEVKHRSVRR